MWPQIQETATTNPNAIGYGKALRTQQREWTIQSLGIELEEESPFTKADFEKAPKKVSRRVKK